MSGYKYPASYPEQSDYSAYTTAYPGVPQYTQSQINHHFAQYHCYPRQPYQIVPDFYTQPIIQPAIGSPPRSVPQPISITQDAYQPSFDEPLSCEEPATQWPSLISPYEHSQSVVQAQSQSQSPARSSGRAKTWTCNVPNCTSSAHFTRLADLQRHQATVHGMGTPEFPCKFPHCSRVENKGFTRRDHLIEHLRNFHKVNVPKRKAGERSAFPFGWPLGMGGEGSQTRSDDRSRLNGE